MLPSFNNNVIVGIKFNNVFNWYLAPKILWALNLDKAQNADKIKYVNLINKVRKNLEVLNNENFNEFLLNLEPLKLNVLEFKKNIKEIVSFDINFIEDFVPSIFIDVDDKIFYVVKPIYKYFVNTIPSKWKISDDDFLEKIDPKYYYWK